MNFQVGDKVTKCTGDYRIGGEVRAVFTTTAGAVRYVVEHKAEGVEASCIFTALITWS